MVAGRQPKRQGFGASSCLGNPSFPTTVRPSFRAFQLINTRHRRCSLTLADARFVSVKRRDTHTVRRGERKREREIGFHEERPERRRLIDVHAARVKSFDRMNFCSGTGMGGVLTLVPRAETSWLPDWRGGFRGADCFASPSATLCLCLSFCFDWRLRVRCYGMRVIRKMMFFNSVKDILKSAIDHFLEFAFEFFSLRIKNST